MSGPHPRDADAAEYALGTLSTEERLGLEREAAADPGLARAIRDWEDRLAPLADDLPGIAPRAEVWSRIEEAVRARGRPDVLPFAAPSDLRRLRRSRALWRGLAGGATAIAASLAGILVLRPPLGSPETSSLVAVVNRAGDLPALIVRVDQRAGIVQVRPVAAETPASRSLELWSIAPGGTPRSLGVVGAGVTRVAIPSGSSPLARDVVLAVSVEPPGGSPSGTPTGPVIYSGKLIPEAP